MLCAADHAVDSVAHSFALIDEAGWGEPVSAQPMRTLWSAKLARGGDAQHAVREPWSAAQLALARETQHAPQLRFGAYPTQIGRSAGHCSLSGTALS